MLLCEYESVNYLLFSKTSFGHLSIDKGIREEINRSTKNDTGIISCLNSTDHQCLLSNSGRILKEKFSLICYT